MSDIHDMHLSEGQIQAFLDGDVSSKERRRVEAHVTGCARCAEELTTWSALFEDLDTLGTHGPSIDFGARVMSGVHVSEAVPWAARARAAVSALRFRRGDEHLSHGVLQDLADGVLTRRGSSRAQRHLEACSSCAVQARAWAVVIDRLSELDRFAPSADFAGRVIAGLESARPKDAATAPAAAPVPTWSRVLSGAKRFVPRTRRAWAAISGAAVTPAVTFGLVLWAVFTHPTLTPQALTSFLLWQVADLGAVAWGGVVSGGLQLTRTVGLDGFVEAMVAAPLITAGALVVYAVAFTVAVRILYKNLVHSRSLRPRYAQASAS